MSHKVNQYRHLTLGFILILVGLIATKVASKPTVSEMNHGHSAAYRSQTVADPVAAPRTDEITTIAEPSWEFSSPADSNMTIGQISFLFNCQPKCPQLWLSLQLKNDEKLELPVYHPTIQKIDWFTISDQGLFLYQRPIRYTSIPQVVKEPPTTLSIIDDSIMPFIALPQAKRLKSTNEIGDANLIITRYQKPEKVGNWYIYQQKIDFRQALIINNQFIWELEQVNGNARVNIARLTGKIIE